MVGNPHDSLFKAVFGSPETAVAHFKCYLPAPLLDRMDLSSAALCPQLLTCPPGYVSLSTPWTA